MAKNIEELSPEYINQLLKAPGKNINSTKRNLIQQMNRTRKNIVLYDSNISMAYTKINEMLKEKKFDLSSYQNKILFGTPDQVTKATHELRAIAIVLRNILDGKGKYNSRLIYNNKYLNLTKTLLRSEITFGGIGVTLLLTGATGGLAIAGIAMAAGVAGLVTSQIRAVRLKASEKDLLLLILKVLDKGKKQNVEEQIFYMTNRNTGSTYVEKGPTEMVENPMFSQSNRKNRKTRKQRKN